MLCYSLLLVTKRSQVRASGRDGMGWEERVVNNGWLPRMQWTAKKKHKRESDIAALRVNCTELLYNSKDCGKSQARPSSVGAAAEMFREHASKVSIDIQPTS